MTSDGKVGWEEIVDDHLDGNFNVQELNEVSSLAYRCVNRSPRKRPSMRDIVQVISRINNFRLEQKHHRKSLSAMTDDVSIDIDHSEHFRKDSMDSASDTHEI